MKKLEKLTLAELNELSEKIAPAIEAAKEKERAALVAKVENLAVEAGYSFAELFKRPRKQRKNLKRVYNPQDKSQSYRGAGPKPKWLKEIEATA